MLHPKQTKYKKSQRGRLKGKICNKKINNFSLQALEPVWLTVNQIEAARKIISKNIKKVGKFYIKIFADKPITQKAKETRMGSGKGNLSHWVAVIKPGMILFEIAGVEKELCIEIFKKIKYKLPIKTKIIL
jgi:large subunit ribosomal protein L16